MSIIQKLVVDKSLTNNFQIIVRDETGTKNPSNENGYFGGYSNNYNIEKYIFELVNLNTGDKYIQVQSDNIENPDEYYNPSVARIINKENVTIDSNNFDLEMFEDGVYKLYMTVKTIHSFYGQGIVGQNIIFNLPGASTIYEQFGYIIVNDKDIYKVIDIMDGTIVLDRHLENDVEEFKAGIRTSNTFILSDKLNLCLNKHIAKFSDDCGCNADVKTINVLSELHLYMWGLERAIERDDIIDAQKYLNLSISLCESLNCECNGR